MCSKGPHLFTIYKSPPLTIRLLVKDGDIYLKCSVLSDRELSCRLNGHKVEKLTKWLNDYKQSGKRQA